MNQSEAQVAARQSPWLSRQSTDFQDVLLSQCRFRSFERGEEVTHVGDWSEELFFLADGIIVLAAAHPVEGMISGQVLRPGQWFGEVASLGKGPRLASGMVRRKAHVLMFQVPAILQAIRATPEFATSIFEMLLGTSETYMLHAVDLTIRSPKARLCSRLMTFAGRSLHEMPDLQVDIPMSQEEIAQASNLSRQSVNQLLRELAESGILELHYGGIRILDTWALAEMVC